MGGPAIRSGGGGGRGVLQKIGGDVIQTRKRTSQPFANCDMIVTVVKYWEVNMIAIVIVLNTHNYLHSCSC